MIAYFEILIYFHVHTLLNKNILENEENISPFDFQHRYNKMYLKYLLINKII